MPHDPAASRRSASDAVRTAAPASGPPPAGSDGHGTSPDPRVAHAGSDDLWVLWSCNLLVFAASVCIMVLELTASRLIAQHVGSSLYTWTSVIGVVLAGITLGNYLGGFLADRIPPQRLLGWLFLAASLLCFSVLWTDGLVGAINARSMGLQMRVLLVVTGIFLLPSIALGTISPVVASLALSRTTRTGITVGNVYAWGALGSIVGTFLAGFWLIDVFGTKTIVVLVSAALGVMGVVVGVGSRVFRAAVLLGWLQFVSVVGLAAGATEYGLAGAGAAFGRCWSRNADQRLLDSLPPLDRNKLIRWFDERFGGRLEAPLHERLVDWKQRLEHQPLRPDAHGGDPEARELVRDVYAALDEEDRVRTLVHLEQDSPVTTASSDWALFGRRLGNAFHELGLVLGLRRDARDEYHDESNYSYVNVADDFEDGDPVRHLKLDKLIHSYWNPEKPTTLYYDYEEIYAAVTERAVRDRDLLTVAQVVALPAPPAGAPAAPWPKWVAWNPEQHTLAVRGGLDDARRRTLLGRSVSAAYWEAVENLFQRTSGPAFGGFESTALDALPPGTEIPAGLGRKLRFDPALQLLHAYERLTADDVQQALAAAPDAGWHAAVQVLYGKSRQVSTFFIGGGGFVFPRWIEAKFPLDPTIDVAELDPAVKRAVQRELGLPPDDRTYVRTTVGDARNVVDDRLRENVRRLAAGEPPLRYDFVYGDAFNDFGVPWHLTTREFDGKIRDLLAPGGVYQVNIIDIYPRTKFPGTILGRGTAVLEGTLPKGLLAEVPAVGESVAARSPHHALTAKRTADRRYELEWVGPMSDETYDVLHELEPQNEAFRDALARMYEQLDRSGGFDGTVPAALLRTAGSAEDWYAAPEPFSWFEVFPLDDGRYELAVRGVVTDDMRDRLTALDPRNEPFVEAVTELTFRSRTTKPGRFLGRYVATVADVFPNVYVFSSEEGLPQDNRDTFVIVCAMAPLDLTNLGSSGEYWSAEPFAAQEHFAASGKTVHRGQFEALVACGRGRLLTDDFAPVDNLLSPVFDDQ